MCSSKYLMYAFIEGYPRQRETAILLSGFQLLVETGCHKDLQTFLCLAMAPPCDPNYWLVIFYPN